MKKPILSLLTLCVVTVSALANQTVIDLLPPAVTLSGAGGTVAEYEVGHQFTTPAGYPVIVKSAEFLIAGDAPAKPGEVIARIYTDINNLPGTLVGTATNSSDVIRTNMSFAPPIEAPVALTFPSTMKLPGGQSYWMTISVHRSTGTWNGWFAAQCLLAGPPPPFVFRPPAGIFTASTFAIPMRLTVGAGDAVPGKNGTMTILPGVKFASIYSPALAEGGAFAFRAKLLGTNVALTNANVIMRYDGGVELVARQGNLAPGVSGGRFCSFGDPVANRYLEVAFAARLSSTPAITNINDQGVWTDLGGTLRLACREATAAPGVSGYAFKTFQWFYLGDDLLFVGAQATNGLLRKTGVWKYNGTNLSKVCAQGDLINIGGTNQTVKTIGAPAGLSTGNVQSRVAMPSGSLLLLITCTNGYMSYVSF